MSPVFGRTVDMVRQLSHYHVYTPRVVLMLLIDGAREGGGYRILIYFIPFMHRNMRQMLRDMICNRMPIFCLMTNIS